jgi:ABC-type Mn2+/Zn2+ transport system ATPase subunit
MTGGSPSPQPLLTLRKVVVGYHDHGILPPIDLEIGPSACWALVGRNGGGKSTLMRSLLGLQPLVYGAIARREGLRVAYVPQRSHFDLSVPARVVDFVAGGLDTGWRFLRPWTNAAERRRVDAALELTDVATLAREPFTALSEGQKQRVLIARALVSEPELLVLDEPTSAMDPMNERALFELLATLCRSGERSLSVLLASHQMSFLPEYASHALLVDKDLGLAVHGPEITVFESEAFAVVYGALRLHHSRSDDAY